MKTTHEPEQESSALFGQHAAELAAEMKIRAHNVLAGTADPLGTAKTLAAGAMLLDVCRRYVAPPMAEAADDDEPPVRSARPKAAKPANACTDGKRHKYGEDRKCGKCGAADPRAPKPDQRTAEIPGVS